MTKSYEGLNPVFGDRRDWTLAHVLRTRARTHADKVFVRSLAEPVAYTFREVAESAERVARNLLDQGGAPGDRVVIMGANSADYLLGWFGCGLAGMAEVPINTAYVGTFLEHQVRVVVPTFVILDAQYAPRFVQLRDRGVLDGVRRFFLIGDSDAVRAATTALGDAGWSAEPFSSLLGPLSRDLPETVPGDPAAIFFTSGTTGLSKGATMTHSHFHFFAQECVSLTRLTDRDVYLSVLPMFHVNGQGLSAYPALIAGAEFVLSPRFSASGWLDMAREYHVTVTNLVGVMSDFVWSQPESIDDDDNDLRCVFGVPTPWSYVDAFRKRFGVESWVETYGMTEASMPVLAPYDGSRPEGSAGLGVLDWYDLRVVDPVTDEELPVGKVGELIVRPKHPGIITDGYYNMSDETVEAFRNLWYHTGDAVRRDADGYYYFVDRLKDAIRRRGENISSYEVEQAILAMPGIDECAAVAVPAGHEAGEEEVLLVVVRSSGEVDAQAVWRWSDEQLPKFAVPRYIRFVDELPKTPTQKIRKAVLREDGVSRADVHERQPARRQARSADR